MPKLALTGYVTIALSLGYQSYSEVRDDGQLANELLLQPVEGTHPPITLTCATKYLKWTILEPTPPIKQTHYDIVLGISTKNLNLDAVEAIIITIQHEIRDQKSAKSEVITSQELRRLYSVKAEDDADDTNTSGQENSNTSKITTTTATTDDPCFLWKLHEKLTGFKEDYSVQFAMEIKTWHWEAPDHGFTAFHYVEILTDSNTTYKDDPLYRAQGRSFTRWI
ncbi:MAG: hypothetical protein J3R72DRAFT_475740 [Linnemannia gamsii]|nr:MAG: hypothetical protein J3R72DRAFT_475740 [Linnemannia gamsii]